MNVALIVAAGNGTRMNIEQPKQFIMVNDKPLFVYSVEAFQKNPHIDMIFIATNASYIEKVEAWCKEFRLTKVKSVFLGGETRQSSVWNGLKKMHDYIKSPHDIVLIHDAARPLVSQRIIDDNISLCERYGAVDTVIQASDTIIQSKDDETIDKILNRNELYQSQTPQSFEYGIINEAHFMALTDGVPNVTDDCKLVMYFGGEVHFVPGDKLNFKVTTFEDLELFRALVNKM